MAFIDAEIVRQLFAASDSVALLHAAWIRAGAQNADVLILGDAGAGKSTLAHFARSAGWDVMCEDAVLIHANGSLSPFPRLSAPRSKCDSKEILLPTLRPGLYIIMLAGRSVNASLQPLGTAAATYRLLSAILHKQGDAGPSLLRLAQMATMRELTLADGNAATSLSTLANGLN